LSGEAAYRRAPDQPRVAAIFSSYMEIRRPLIARRAENVDSSNLNATFGRVLSRSDETSLKGHTMDRTSTLGAKTPPGTNPLSNPATSAKIESGAQSAHQTVDKVADTATSQVDRLSGQAHRAVNAAADAANAAAEWASTLPDQAKQYQTKVTEAACTSIRARPIASVAGALVVGYLLGRLARL
jgi:hypothetical protein